MVMRAGGTLQTSIRCASLDMHVTACCTVVLLAAGVHTHMLILHNMPRQPDSAGSGMTGAHGSADKGTALHELPFMWPLLPQAADLYSLTNHIQPCEACNLLAVSQLQAVTGPLSAGRQPFQGKCP